MPLRRDDMGHEPFEPIRVGDQLGEQIAQIPVEEDAADVEDHGLPNHAPSRHAKAPPEASDGVTLTCTARTGRERPGRAHQPWRALKRRMLPADRKSTRLNSSH